MNSDNEYKHHPEYPILVGSNGCVMNEAGGKLKPYTTRCGYECVRFRHAGNRFAKSVHRLVASAFLISNGKPCVNHIDGNKKNNTVKNLEWVTHSENVLHAIKNGLQKPAVVGETQKRNGTQRGERNGRAKLTSDQVYAIRNEPKSVNGSNPIPWVRYGISSASYSNIRNGKSWRHLA